MATKAPRRGRRLPGLKAVREEKFVTQLELAEAAGVTQGSVSALETGDRGAYTATIRKLAAALEVEPGALVRNPDREKEPITTNY